MPRLSSISLEIYLVELPVERYNYLYLRDYTKPRWGAHTHEYPTIPGLDLPPGCRVYTLRGWGTGWCLGTHGFTCAVAYLPYTVKMAWTRHLMP